MKCYILSPEAKTDIADIRKYTTQEWGKGQTEKYTLQLQARMRWLADNPMLGRSRNEIREGYRSFNEGNHVIFYRVAENAIEIIGIPHPSMDIEQNSSDPSAPASVEGKNPSMILPVKEQNRKTDMIDLIIDQRARDLGGGFVVGRVLPFAQRRMVGPFIFFDHLGPLDLPPGIPRELDVKPHPHIGLSTVTYLYSGAITHRDSLGCHQEIWPGEVNWMVAGRGITHSERLEHARSHGASMHGIQAWVALPAEDEETDPAFHHHEGADLPEWREDGVRVRLIAGEADGLRAKVVTHSPLFYQHWEMDAGARRSIGTDYPERAVYVALGEIDLAGQRLGAGQMAVLSGGRPADVLARQASTLMVLGGDPIGERFIYWNFVSSSKERLEQAREDWRQQRMKLPAGDDREFARMPEEPAATPPVMS